MENHQHINQTSGDVEYYTPGKIVEAARLTMGGIDLDPASSAAANARVRAVRFFTEADNGLSKKWKGRVWMNHPFQRREEPCKTFCDKKICKKRGHCIDKAVPGNEDWIKKIVAEFSTGGGTGGLLYHVCQYVGKLVSSVAELPAMLFDSTYELSLAGRNHQARRHEGKRRNVFWKGCRGV